ncbi:MAG: hypothetical protein V1899_08870 [Planctomycetota bacterium]
MKLPCPSCAQALNLPDKLVGKTVKCPACQKSFSAPTPSVSIADYNLVIPESPPPSSAEELALRITDEANSDAPFSMKACPYCGAPWTANEPECRKCHYNTIMGKRMRRPKIRLLPNFNIQKLFLYAALIGAAYGAYWVFINWHRICDTVNNKLDNATRSAPSADDSSVLTRKNIAPTKKLSRD